MGLIKAAAGAAGGVLADQWKEYFYCEAMPADVLITKAHKKVSGRSSNKHGSENIISNGSVIAVNDGQCMLIVEQFSVEILEREFVMCSSRSASVLHSEEKPRRIREFILSIPKNL